METTIENAFAARGIWPLNSRIVLSNIDTVRATPVANTNQLPPTPQNIVALHRRVRQAKLLLKSDKDIDLVDQPSGLALERRRIEN